MSSPIEGFGNAPQPASFLRISFAESAFHLRFGQMHEPDQFAYQVYQRARGQNKQLWSWRWLLVCGELALKRMASDVHTG